MSLAYDSCPLAMEIAGCNKCQRLRKFCSEIATKKRKAYAADTYWGKPVPNFGHGQVSLLVVGLAPAAHGANRTSRMFTGDRSGQWLYRALHKAGFAKTAAYERADDNELLDCMITSVAHCAPPDNKPTAEEIVNCRPFLEQTIRHAKPKAILCLGSLAWTETLKVLASSPAKFAHGAQTTVDTNVTTDMTTTLDTAKNRNKKIKVFASFHPSQQNTFTKRLTEPMFDSVFSAIREGL